MIYDKLLAKSPRDGREITLQGHTEHVIEAATALFGTAMSLNAAWQVLAAVLQIGWRRVARFPRQPSYRVRLARLGQGQRRIPG